MKELTKQKILDNFDWIVDKLNWNDISISRDLTEALMRDFHEHVNWYKISVAQFSFRPDPPSIKLLNKVLHVI